MATRITPQRRCVSLGKLLDVSQKYQYSNCHKFHNLKDNIMITFSVNSPVIAHCKHIIFVWVGMPDFREQQVESKVKTGKKLSFFQQNQGHLFKICPGRLKAPLYTFLTQIILHLI